MSILRLKELPSFSFVFCPNGFISKIPSNPILLPMFWKDVLLLLLSVGRTCLPCLMLSNICLRFGSPSTEPETAALVFPHAVKPQHILVHPQELVWLCALLRGFSAPCLFHLPRNCRSVCQNNAIYLRFYPKSEVKAQNYNFWYSISLNISYFNGICRLPNTQQVFSL